LFVDDIRLDNQYFAISIRSQAAGCKLKDIICPALDSQYRLIRAADIPGIKNLADSSIPVLAEENLGYIGEPVAILVGPDAVKLEELAAEIIVELEDAPPPVPEASDASSNGNDSVKPPVFSLTEPEAEIAVQIMRNIDASIPPPAHKEKPLDAASPAEDADAPDTPPEPEPPVITGTYRSAIQEHWYSEPHGALANPTDSGIAVYTATQWPDHVKRSVAAALSLSEEDVSLETADTGLHFDGKIWYPSLIAVHAALAAFIMKQPVKLMLTREEDFRFSPKRTETVIEFSTRLNPDGEPAETDIKVRAGFGAGSFFANEMLDNIAKAAAGYYKLGNIKLSADAVLTNLPPAGPFAGFGTAQGVFALERHIAKIADAQGLDCGEWRNQHYNEKKAPVDEIVKLSENLITHSDYRRKWAAYELLRDQEKMTGKKMNPRRGVGITTVIYEDVKPSFVAEDAARVNHPEAGARPPIASAIIELEIDNIDFSAKIRSLWMSVCTGILNDKRTMRRKLLQNIVCALGWTAFEKLDYKDGKIDETDYFHYNLPVQSAIPRIHISLSERGSEENNPEVICELPYCVIPAAYLQALTQACNHHFESIPVFSRDIWSVLNENEQESAPHEAAQSAEQDAARPASGEKEE
jgi:CO/xanthine dehydrogenase Mo-binding subunit